MEKQTVDISKGFKDHKFKSILDIKNKISKGLVSSVEVVAYYTDNIKKYSHLNAFIEFNPEYAMQKAKEADERIKSGNSRDFEGVPIVMKDVFCTKDIKTTSSSAILKDFQPKYDATVVKKLREKGFIIIGKSNCDEFAAGSDNTTSYFGKVYNPLDLERIPGGSSGGSASSVAADCGIAATTTDTGGSSRQPASCTGTVGLCPTYGVISRYGVIPLASSLDRPGVLTKNVEDARILFDIIKGYDDKDPSSEDFDEHIKEMSKSDSSLAESMKICITKKDKYIFDENKESIKIAKKLKICIPKELDQIEFEEDVLNHWKSFLSKADFEVEVVSLPSIFYSIDIYKILAFSEIYSGLAKYDGIHFGTREKGESFKDCVINTRKLFGDEIKRRLLIGSYILSSENYNDFYIQASKMRSRIIREFSEVFKKYDIILTPSTTTKPPKFSDKLSANQMYGQDLLTSPVNMAGVCAISVPYGVTKDNLSLGLQIVSNRFCDYKMFDFASYIESLVKKGF